TGEVSSYFYKSKKTIPLKEFSNYESFEEVSLEFPDKIQVIYSNKMLLSSQFPSSFQLTRTWNGKKYKSISETDLFGKRTVRDTTNEDSKPISKNVSDVIGKKTAAALQDAQKADPKSIFTESLWTSVFPLVLSHPFEKNIKFEYAGKAKSNETTANVIDVKTANGKKYRLLFDSETNYLLMMIVSFRVTNDRFVGDVEDKYYFSEYELTDGLLIPKKIKVEKKATPEGKSPVIKFFNIEILDFKLNPKFDEKTFEIK
ncbi:MAG: hypothetical protein ACR2L1_09365, partial [Pyrinomonadaceae bacterium]